MVTLDIRGTVIGDSALAIKQPCLVATTGSPITLSGVQTIDGVTVGNNSERVLVKDQTDTSNGIYIAQTSSWVPAADFDGNTDVVLGTLVLVTSGALNQGIMFEQTCTDNPIVIGTSIIAFNPLANATAQSATSTTSLTIGTGAQTLAIEAGKAFAANQWVVIYETANSTNAMLAQVTSYSGTSLVVNVTATGGSGTFAAWTVVLTNSQAAAGIQPPVGSGNVTGPGSAASGHVATFADDTGKVIADGGTLGSIAALSAVSAQYLAPSAVMFGAAMVNGTIVPSVASNALTFAIKTFAGNVPSSADPAWFVFRDATNGGAYDIIEVTSALTVTIPSGSTLGSSNATPFRVWIVALNSGGNVSLGVINCLSGTSIYPLGQAVNVNTTAFGSSANFPQVLYAVTSLSGVAYSVLGYATYEAGSTLATAGSYASAPSQTRLFMPGNMPLPGHPVQRQRTQTGAEATGTTVFTINNATPTNTQGDQYMSQAITPTSSANLLAIVTRLCAATSAGNTAGMGLFQDSTSNALTALATVVASNNLVVTAALDLLMQAGTLSSTTFKIRAGCSSSGTMTFNGEGGAGIFNGALNSFIDVQEIMA